MTVVTSCLICTPKSHCEIAGMGIEYCWGKSKHYFRHHNDCDPANLHDNVVKSLSVEVLPLARVRKFARRTREFKRAYRELGTEKSGNYGLVARMVKERKRHRNAADFDKGFIRHA